MYNISTYNVYSDALVIAAVSPKEDEISFPKSLALHAALFHLELHDVILAFCHDKVAMRVSHTGAYVSLTLALAMRVSHTGAYARTTWVSVTSCIHVCMYVCMHISIYLYICVYIIDR